MTGPSDKDQGLMDCAEQEAALATFNEALDEWGCTDPAKRAEAIAGFIAGGCQLWEYEVQDVAEVVGHA